MTEIRFEFHFIAVNRCRITCGDKEGVRCIGDPVGDSEVECICEDQLKEFHSEDKSCKGMEFLTLIQNAHF